MTHSHRPPAHVPLAAVSARGAAALLSALLALAACGGGNAEAPQANGTTTSTPVALTPEAMPGRVPAGPGEASTGDITEPFQGVWLSRACEAGGIRNELVIERVANNQLQADALRMTYANAACEGSPVRSERVAALGRATLGAQEASGGWRFSRTRLAPQADAGTMEVWGVRADGDQPRLCRVVLPQSLLPMSTDAVAKQLDAAPTERCYGPPPWVIPIPAPGPLSAGGGARRYTGLYGAANDECLLAASIAVVGQPSVAARRAAVRWTLGANASTLVGQPGALDYADTDCMGAANWTGGARTTYTLQPSELAADDLAFNRYVAETPTPGGASVRSAGVFVQHAAGPRAYCLVPDDSSADGALPTAERALALARGAATDPKAFCPYSIDPTGVQGF